MSEAPVGARPGAAPPGWRLRWPGRRPNGDGSRPGAPSPGPGGPVVPAQRTDPDRSTDRSTPRVHPLVAQAWAALDDAGVRWALLRGEGELADPRSDVDLLIGDPGDLPAVRRALRPLGIAAVPQWGEGAHRHFWGYHRPTRRWIELDVEWSLDFGPQLHFTLNWLAPTLRTGAAQAVLARRRRDPDLPGTWLLHPDDGFWALLLHAVVDKAVVVEQHADRLGELCVHATPAGPLAEVVTALCPPGWDAARVIRHARSADWPALVDLGRLLTRRAGARRPVVRRARALGRGLRRLGGALRTALVTRGTSVAILGPDAVARSTLAAGLASGLPPATRLVPAHPVWRRWSVAPHRLRGRTVVFDGHVPRRADVVIVLDLPGSAEASARPNLSQGHGERAVHVVRADRPRDEVLADVTEIVWRAWTAGRPRARRTPE